MALPESPRMARRPVEHATGELQGVGHESDDKVTQTRTGALATLFVACALCVAGVTLATLSNEPDSTSSVVSGTLNTILLIIIPSPSSPISYSWKRSLCGHFFRLAALLCGLCGATKPLITENHIQCWTSAFATVCSFIYSRLDDQKRHHCFHDQVHTTGCPKPARYCTQLMGGALRLLGFSFVSVIIAICVQPDVLRLKYPDAGVTPLTLYITVLPAVAFLFDIGCDRGAPCSVFAPGLVVGALMVAAAFLASTESLPGMIRNLILFLSCWISVATIPCLRACGILFGRPEFPFDRHRSTSQSSAGARSRASRASFSVVNPAAATVVRVPSHASILASGGSGQSSGHSFDGSVRRSGSEQDTSHGSTSIRTPPSHLMKPLLSARIQRTVLDCPLRRIQFSRAPMHS